MEESGRGPSGDGAQPVAEEGVRVGAEGGSTQEAAAGGVAAAADAMMAGGGGSAEVSCALAADSEGAAKYKLVYRHAATQVC